MPNEIPYETHDEWLAIRRKGIGGSDISAVMGVNKWEGPLGIYFSKKGERPPKDESFAMKYGKLTEDIVVGEFIEEHPDIKVTEVPKVIYQHNEHPWMLATPDRWLEHPSWGRGIFEAKTTGSYSSSDWNEDIPDAALSQLCWYMAVCDVEWGFVGVIIGNVEYKSYMVWRDQELENAMILAGQDFWSNHIERSVPPEADHLGDTGSMLASVYKNPANDAVVDLDSKGARLLQQLVEARSQEKLAKERKTQLENELKVIMGNSGIAHIEDTPVLTWKVSQRNSLDTSALKAKHPKIAKEFTVTKELRTFLVAARK